MHGVYIKECSVMKFKCKTEIELTGKYSDKFSGHYMKLIKMSKNVVFCWRETVFLIYDQIIQVIIINWFYKLKVTFKQIKFHYWPLL